MYKVVIKCLYDVVYEVASMLDLIAAEDLREYVAKSMEDGCYVDLLVKSVEVLPM